MKIASCIKKPKKQRRQIHPTKNDTQQKKVRLNAISN